MKYILIILTLLAFTANAQEPIKPLQVGDKLPETFWQQEHSIYANGKTSKQTLAPYKGKLLILDFWATWCGSCIKKMPEIANLQRQYPNELAMLLVSKVKSDADSNKVKRAFNTYAKGLNLQTILADEYLVRLFPHWQLPHYVWIGPKGNIIGYTNSDFLTSANLSNLNRKEGGQ